MHNYALKKHSVFVANDVYNYRKLLPFLKFEFKAKLVTMSLNFLFFSIKYGILSNNYSLIIMLTVTTQVTMDMSGQVVISEITPCTLPCLH